MWSTTLKSIDYSIVDMVEMLDLMINLNVPTNIPFGVPGIKKNAENI